jgi:hypothetical protein
MKDFRQIIAELKKILMDGNAVIYSSLKDITFLNNTKEKTPLIILHCFSMRQVHPAALLPIRTGRATSRFRLCCRVCPKTSWSWERSHPSGFRTPRLRSAWSATWSSIWWSVDIIVELVERFFAVCAARKSFRCHILKTRKRESANPAEGFWSGESFTLFCLMYFINVMWDRRNVIDWWKKT